MQLLKSIYFSFFSTLDGLYYKKKNSWKKVHFSELNLNDKVFLSDIHFSRNLFGSLTCSSITIFKFWCVKIDKFCYFYNLVVSLVFYTTEDYVIDCYTEKEK